jgi:hypothetical protein
MPTTAAISASNPAAAPSARTDLATVVAIAAIAFAGADVVHEIIGHVGMCLITGVKSSLISTVGITTDSANPWVRAAGTLANLITGGLAFLAYRAHRRSDAAAYFFWLFGTVNLINIGYFIFSGVTGTGDWGAIIEGLQPQIAWRVVMAIAGYFGYVAVLFLSTRLLLKRASADQLWRLVLPAYLGGGAVMVIASAFNPQGAHYIWWSGVSSWFVLTLGLLRIPAIARKRFAAKSGAGLDVGRSFWWIVAGVVAAVLCIAVVGRGIRIG